MMRAFILVRQWLLDQFIDSIAGRMAFSRPRLAPLIDATPDSANVLRCHFRDNFQLLGEIDYCYREVSDSILWYDAA